MVEDVVRVGLAEARVQDTGVPLSSVRVHVASHGEARRTHVHVLLVREAECHRHVVNNPGDILLRRVDG